MADMNDFLQKLGIAPPQYPNSPMDPAGTPPKTTANQLEDPSTLDPADLAPATEEEQEPGAPLMSKEDVDAIQSIPLPGKQPMPASTGAATPMAPAADAPAAAKTSGIAPEDILAQYRKLSQAQSDARDKNKDLTMLLGGNQIAQAFASGRGAKIGDGSDVIKQLRDQANQPVTDIKNGIDLAGDAVTGSNKAMELQRLQQAADPNSAISKAALEQYANAMLKMSGKTSPEDKAALMEKLKGISALDLEKLGKGAGGIGGTTHVNSKAEKILINGHPAEYSPYTGYIDSVTKKPLAPDDKITNMTPRVDPRTGEITYISPDSVSSATNKQQIPAAAPGTDTAKKEEAAYVPNVAARAALDKKENEFDGMIKDHTQRLRDADALLAELNSNNKLQIPAIRERVARIAKGGGVLSQYDEQAFGGSSAVMDQINQWLQTHTESTFTPENKAQFHELMNTYVDTAKQAIPDAQNRFANRMQMSYQVPPEFTKKYLGGMPSTPNLDKDTFKKPGTPPASDIVTIQGPSGQKVQMKKAIAQDYIDGKKGNGKYMLVPNE